MIQKVWQWLNTEGTAIGVLLALVPLVWIVWSYLIQKNKELKHQRFITYHQLITDLLGGDGKTVYLDKQVAIIFELRKFKEYYKVSWRILGGLLESWKEPKHARVINEIKLTMRHMESRWWWKKDKSIA